MMKITQATCDKLIDILANDLKEDYELSLRDEAIFLGDALSLDEWDWRGCADDTLSKLLKVLEIDVDLD